MTDALRHLDSGTLIGLLDSGDSHNEAVKNSVGAIRREGGSFAISAVVLAEVLVGPSRFGKSAVEKTRLTIQQLCPDEPSPVDSRIAGIAARLRADNEWLRAIDALIVAASQVVDAEALLTTDKQLARLPKVLYVGE